MSPGLINALVSLGVGFGAAAVLTPVSIWMAKRNGAVARPVKDRWNRREVPVLGGTAIFVGFVIAFLVTGGHLHHGEQALDQLLFMRPTPSTARYETPVGGLYLGSSGSQRRPDFWSSANDQMKAGPSEAESS